MESYGALPENRRSNIVIRKHTAQCRTRALYCGTVSDLARLSSNCGASPDWELTQVWLSQERALEADCELHHWHV